MTVQTMFVKPASGLKIRMPNDPAKYLPAAGAEVPVNQFWARRIAEGSVARVKPAAAAAAPAIDDTERTAKKGGK